MAKYVSMLNKVSCFMSYFIAVDVVLYVAKSQLYVPYGTIGD